MSERSWKIAIAVFLLFLAGVVLKVMLPVVFQPGQGMGSWIIGILVILGLSLLRYLRRK